MSEEKARVARYRLVEKLHRFKVIFFLVRSANLVDKFFCSQVEIIGSQVRCRPLRYGRYLFRRQLRLTLFGDFFSNLALDGKDISQLAVLFLDPDMRVIAGI